MPETEGKHLLQKVAVILEALAHKPSDHQRTLFPVDLQTQDLTKCDQ